LTIPRIHFPSAMEEGRSYQVGKEHLRYLRDVLRISSGERLILFDGEGNDYEAHLQRFTDEGAIVEIARKESSPEDAIYRITLLQALPKAGTMDFIVQKASELGVTKIVPFISSRSVPRLPPQKRILKVIRWQKIALEASRQSRRTRLPEIGQILSLGEALAQTDGADMKIMLWEEERHNELERIMKTRRFHNAQNIAVIIGPEGGFAESEADEAHAAGFTTASIGTRILKVDTAVVAALTMVQYERSFFRRRREGEKHDL
jgi:16S rRNA (uracil1498-N3)-methyltransferase